MPPTHNNIQCTYDTRGGKDKLDLLTKLRESTSREGFCLDPEARDFDLIILSLIFIYCFFLYDIPKVIE